MELANGQFKNYLMGAFSGSGRHWLAICFTFSIIVLLVVIFRMKRVEQDYRFHKINKKIEKIRFENEELKATYASIVSTKNLNTMAKRFHLIRPGSQQIIIIP